MSPNTRRAREPRKSNRITHMLRTLGQSLVEPGGDRRAPRETRNATTLIGLDVARSPLRFKTRAWVPLVAAGIIAAMFLAVLRVDVTRTRFGLAESVAEELRLESLKRELTVEKRKLRDPAELTRRARELGFDLAERLIDLPGEAAPAAPYGEPLLPPDLAPAGRTVEVVALENAGGLRP